MATIILRDSGSITSPGATVKGTPLTNLEVDNNFSNINVTLGVLSNLTTTSTANLVAAINTIKNGIEYTAVKTSNYTAVINDGVQTNTTAGAFTVTLPASPSTGNQVFVADSFGTWATNNLTIGRNSSTIEGVAQDLVCDISGVNVQCVYNGTTWDIYAQVGANDSAVVTLNGTQTLTNKTLTAPTITSPTVTGTGTIAASTLSLSSTLTVTGAGSIEGLTVGRGAGNVNTSTALGYQAALLSTTSNSVSVGYQAHYRNLSGNNCTAVGHQALYGGASADADGCVAIGHLALTSVTLGDFNTAVGMESLKATTSGANNTAVGYQAGYTNSTASYNTAVGYQAGYTTNTGGVTAFGSFSLFTNASGTNLTALGHNALYSCTVSDNTAVGYAAGYNTSTGQYNAFFGGREPTTNFATGQNNTLGSSNSAFGHGALANNTTASDNTAVGYQAGYSNTTGQYNTAIGYQAGYTNQTSQANFFGGWRAGYLSTGGDNCLVGWGSGQSLTTATSCAFFGVQTGYYTTGTHNNFIGASAGYYVTTGAYNTILGGFSGNQDSLDIRTASNYAVISDGAGNRQITMKEGQTLALDSAVPNAGTGITFPATQSASADANTLDDYEEGTWTPTLAFGGNSVGITFTASYNTSSYTKIGSRVFVSGVTILTSKGSSTGNATLENLPFPATGVSGFSAVTISLAGTTFTGQYAAELDANNAEISFYQVTTAGVQSALTNTNFSNSSAFTFSFSYYTT